MAKVILTIEDGDGGTVSVSAEFDPELDMKTATEYLTNAQGMGLDLLEDIKNGESFMDSLAKGLPAKRA